MSDDAILEILHAIQADVAIVKADLASVKGDHGRKLDMLQQDTGLMRGVLSGHTRTLSILLQDVRMVRGATNDFAKESVTPGEVEAMHQDLNRLQQEVSELTARLEILEGRSPH
jgi:hypothetical protein